jgi:cellulose synthase/poly-beta-1,6-N-acetylglucosamine synthase-like glycosyltransferase
MERDQQQLGELRQPTDPAAQPRVSVIIPAYNTAAFIAETLDSVFAQTFRDFEVLVVNDGSPDTEELERVLQPYLGRITYIRQENRGVAGARNAGILRSRGEYVAFLDGDDTWNADYMSAQLGLLESQEGVDLVYADLRIVGDTPDAGRTWMEFCPSHGTANFESIVREDCQVSTSTVMARKQTVMAAGMFDGSVRRAEDYHLWIRIAHRGGRILYQRRVLGTYRVRSDSQSSDQLAHIEAPGLALAKLDRQLDLSPQQHAVVRRRQAYCEARVNVMRGKRLMAQGEGAQARECLEKANAFLGSFRIRLAVLGLRMAPRLTATLAALWDRTLRAKPRL